MLICIILISNLIQLVNTEHDSLQANERVQECLQNAKLARKQIVRYIQVTDADHHFLVNLSFKYSPTARGERRHDRNTD